MKNPDHKEIDFAANLKELEAITVWFESEEIDLDQALVKFERGMELASGLKSHLQKVENKVEQVKQKFNAPAVIEPTDEPSTEAEPDEKKSESNPPDLFSA